MATKRQGVDCYLKAKPDEPMFVLLGRDPDASLLVEFWAEIRRKKGEVELAMEADECAKAMAEWCEAMGKTVTSMTDAVNVLAGEHQLCPHCRGSGFIHGEDYTEPVECDCENKPHNEA